MNNLLFIISYADTDNEIDKLISALTKLSSHKTLNCISQTNNSPFLIPHSSLKLTPREAFYAKASTVKLDDSINKICAEEVTLYPPGVPVLYPGEVITEEIVNYIKTNKKINSHLIGAADTSLNTIKIIRN